VYFSTKKKETIIIWIQLKNRERRARMRGVGVN